uniref:Tcc1j12.3 n=1 Tax=Trypanosoma cruzi TaxID=5693 RepID=Q8T302_TRYCR|nr:Tcc1j12.3 [Trypanosoma cruzi]
MVVCLVFRLLLALALLCCCSCVCATEKEQEVVPVDAECAGNDKLGRWRISGKPSWYNCSDSSSGAGKMICDMGVGTCATENAEGRHKGGGVKDGVFTINVSTYPQSMLERWWERNVEPKSANGGIASAASSGAGSSVPQEEAATRDASPTPKPASPAAGAEGSAGTSSPLETPGSAGVNSPAGIAGTGGTTDSSSSAASRAPDLAPSGELPGAARSTSAASSAPESPPDTRPTGGGSHSSHDSPVELQEESSAAPLTQLSQTGEDGSAAEGTEEDAATSTDDTPTSEGNTTAASMPAPLSSAPTTKALENRVGNDACFHDTRPHARLLLVLAALMYGTLG